MPDWIRIVNSLPSHPKILRAGGLAPWLYVCGLCYSNEHLTDGYIARDVLVVAAPGVKAPERLAEQLVKVGLWHPVEGGWQIHDYEDHQRTSSQVREVREKDRRRKRRAESNGTFRADSARNPDGIQLESEWSPVGPSRASRANPALEKRRKEKNPPTPQGGNAGEDDPTEPDRSGVVTFRRRRVPAPQLETAERALAAFNRHTGQNVSPYRSDGRPSEALTRILGAVTDKPEKLTGEYCERLVGDVLRRRWWGEGPASVGVVFGPAVLDRNLAALDGAGAVAAKSSLELAREIHGGAA